MKLHLLSQAHTEEYVSSKDESASKALINVGTASREGWDSLLNT